MAAIHGRYTKLWVDEFDLSSQNNSLDMSIAVDALDGTAFQDTGAVTYAGIPTGKIAQKGYFTGKANGMNEDVLYDRLGVATATVAALFGTATTGCPAYVSRTTGAEKMMIATTPNALMMIDGDWVNGGGIIRGLRVWEGTFSATGAQTSPGYIDVGAVGSAGGAAYLFVQTITGSATNATITVESDDNTSFTSAATEGTFTFSAVGVQTMALSGTVDRYIRLNCTSKGGATSFVVGAIVCVSGVTYAVV